MATKYVTIQLTIYNNGSISYLGFGFKTRGRHLLRVHLEGNQQAKEY